jgi:dienelactone hydrolase
MLIYLTTVEGTADIYSRSLETGEEKRLTREGVYLVSVTEKSDLVVYGVDESKGRELIKLYAVKAHGGDPKPLSNLPPRRITGIAWDGEKVVVSLVGEKGFEIWRIKPGKSEELIATHIKPIAVTSTSKNYTAGIVWETAESWSILLLDNSTGEYREYTPRKGSMNRTPALNDDGTKMLFASNFEGDENLYVADTSSLKAVKVRTRFRDHVADKPTEYVGYDWIDDSSIWFLGKKNGRVSLYVDGKRIRLPPGFSMGAKYFNGKIYISRSSLTTPPRILEIDVESGRWRSLYGGRIRSRRIQQALGKRYMVNIESFDGLKIPTYVVESRYTSKPGPTVIYIHGGPWWEVADYWEVIIESLVVSGFHVVAPNFRGSTGYGEEFRRLDIGDPGGGDLEDIVYTAKWAKESGLASKLAIMGYSYGGFMTFLATVKKPDLWDAGVAGAGVADWEELYELGDQLFKQFVEMLFAGRRDLWKDRSAINFAENLKAPLCIIHPQNDTRTPLKPVLRYALKLSGLGKTFEMHVIPDMGHTVNNVDDVLNIVLPAVRFLTKILKA